MIHLHPYLVIMAAGASSRMKRSLAETVIDPKIVAKATQVHKAMIPLGESQEPLIARLLTHAQKAGYTHIFLIVAEGDTTFKQWWQELQAKHPLRKLQLHFVYQKTPASRTKPLGTADAVFQALNQYPELQQSSFTVCNGDNLYDIHSLTLLLQERATPNALIAYDREGLQFENTRIAAFALLQTDAQGFLTQIVEKPQAKTLIQYADQDGKLRVSMNIFNFQGKLIYPYLRDCPLDPVRNEKELPQVLRNYIQDHPKKVWCYPKHAHLPDLTSAEDLKKFK